MTEINRGLVELKRAATQNPFTGPSDQLSGPGDPRIFLSSMNMCVIYTVEDHTREPGEQAFYGHII